MKKKTEKKRKIPGHIPFSFLHELGHNTRAMERFFSLPPDAQAVLEDSVSIADDPEQRSTEIMDSLEEGGKGYREPFSFF